MDKDRESTMTCLLLERPRLDHMETRCGSRGLCATKCMRPLSTRPDCSKWMRPLASAMRLSLCLHMPHTSMIRLVHASFEVRARKPNAHIILGIDANARVGSVKSKSIGLSAPNKENDNGERFRIYLEAVDLYAINTFSDAGNTWVSSFGTESRIDYISSSVSPFTNPNSAEVLRSIELATAEREDHRVLACRMALAANNVAPVARRNVEPR
eukprot:7431373-Karenia_brevis.AAC.1